MGGWNEKSWQQMTKRELVMPQGHMSADPKLVATRKSSRERRSNRWWKDFEWHNHCGNNSSLWIFFFFLPESLFWIPSALLPHSFIESLNSYLPGNRNFLSSRDKSLKLSFSLFSCFCFRHTYRYLYCPWHTLYWFTVSLLYWDFTSFL